MGEATKERTAEENARIEEVEQAYIGVFDKWEAAQQELALVGRQRDQLSAEISRLGQELGQHKDLLLEVFAENHNLRKALAVHRSRARDEGSGA